ncbi:small GTP-binding protein, putative [Trichomonas vaginalis G3]|uniref:Small GTP-binding protein, putative n=1 Tax=Trichomonas vaginalis (strain ATCC PRA-98 / G3) TaxID=412133 RepID=A2E9E6_TRIV3|nr:retrograde vesicle-mediated transport, Golgi to ER [Trichomonas vaginalis G3]EAY10710.1 small GTP-binding protein, putative [Trichomonas vaginalis G3]KAI5538603.1 retrograde vesicle-mediated transport, Golgi to ER [Trichomonas vaginalis G3]|eukprot:XP_001322933.1 small GTP-binding protein [Trichomonas vaginalis G3]
MQVEDPGHLRIVLVGDSSVGKTSLLNQLVLHNFNKTEPSTVGANYQLYSYEENDRKIEMQIWDTAGQERFRSLGPIYFRKAAGVVAVFDLTSKNSFVNLQSWIDSFTDVAGTETIIAVAANKCDLPNQEITFSVAEQWAKAHGYIIHPTSALSGEGVQELFKHVASELANSKWAKKQNQIQSRELDNSEVGRPSGCSC